MTFFEKSCIIALGWFAGHKAYSLLGKNLRRSQRISASRNINKLTKNLLIYWKLQDMFTNDLLELHKMNFGLKNILLIVGIAVTDAFGQSPNRAKELQSDGSDWWMIALFILVSCLAFSIYYRYKTKTTEVEAATPYKRISYSNTKQRNGNSTADRGVEWLKKNQTGSGNQENASSSRSKNGSRKPNRFSAPNSATVENIDEVSTVLPIYSFLKVKATTKYNPLPVSDDPALLSAIEQVREEFEEDEEIRSLAVRILAAFKTSNSIDALAQVALYDLSANQRSVAVTTLSEFDHESVFETILLACADPTREVRAAAARALFHLTFDRAEAWARIANLGQQGRMVQMARAAIEADLVERSFERLVHRDRKYAYEAFALVTMLIRASEMDVVTEFLQKTGDAKLRRAILHTIKVSKNKQALEGLKSVLKKKNLSPDLQEDVDKTIEEMGFVTV